MILLNYDSIFEMSPPEKNQMKCILEKELININLLNKPKHSGFLFY